MYRALPAALVLLASCNNQPLSPPDVESSALACHAEIHGAITWEVGANRWPKALAYLDPQVTMGQVALGCERENDLAVGGAQLSVWVPRGAGTFTGAPASFDTNSPTDGQEFQGTCSGEVTTGAQQVGDWFRGSYSCRSLSGVSDTPATSSIEVVDGLFDIQVMRAPPE